MYHELKLPYVKYAGEIAIGNQKNANGPETPRTPLVVYIIPMRT